MKDPQDTDRENWQILTVLIIVFVSLVGCQVASKKEPTNLYTPISLKSNPDENSWSQATITNTPICDNK